MAFFNNALNFPNLTSKATPVGADLVIIADSAAANALKQATVSSIQSAGGAGSLVKIASATGSNAATVNFDNNLSATYDNYFVVFQNCLPVNNAVSFYMQFGTGATPTYQATNYQSAGVTIVGAIGFAGPTTAIGINSSARIANTAARVGGGAFTIQNANTAADKTATGDCTFVDSTAAGENSFFFGGRWKDTTVITSLRFLMSAANISTITATLYGLVK